MSDIAASAILMSWELNFHSIADYNGQNADAIVDMLPFKKGRKGTIYTCKMEPRQEVPDPNFEIKCYYYPLVLGRDKAPNVWKFYDSIQCRPFHPPGGPHAY